MNRKSGLREAGFDQCVLYTGIEISRRTPLICIINAFNQKFTKENIFCPLCTTVSLKLDLHFLRLASLIWSICPP